YVGMTTSSSGQYRAIGRVLAREKPDFFQVNYSLGDREAEAELLPTARDAGTAVLVNLPFGRNSLFRKAGDRPLPDCPAEFGARRAVAHCFTCTRAERRYCADRGNPDASRRRSW